MKKSEFLLKISKLNEPTLHYCPNSGDLTHYSFTIKVSRRYEDWGEGQFFYTPYVVYRKYSNDDYMKYLERIEKLKKKIKRWFHEYIDDLENKKITNAYKTKSESYLDYRLKNIQTKNKNKKKL